MDPTSSPIDSATFPRRAVWSLLFAFWVVIGVLMFLQYYVTSLAEGITTINGGPTVTFEMITWGTWSILTLWVLWLARRVPLERSPARHGARQWGRWLAVHVPISLLTAGLHVGFSTLVVMFVRPFRWEPPFTFWLSYVRLMGFYLPMDVLVYWAVLAIGMAMKFYGKYREGEVQLARAQLQALRMQLHPHFLFNTLNAIATFVRRQKNHDATDMIAGLSDLLRLTLESDGVQEVSLEQELDLLDRYLSIEQIRFGDRLTVDVDVAPEVLGARVPNLILQPLVENAVLHGVASRRTPGRIAIRAGRRDGRLHLQVSDDGPGFPVGTAARHGVGLHNTAARLKHLYGSAHRLTFANAAEGGAVVTLELPFQLDEPARS